MARTKQQYRSGLSLAQRGVDMRKGTWRIVEKSIFKQEHRRPVTDLYLSYIAHCVGEHVMRGNGIARYPHAMIKVEDDVKPEPRRRALPLPIPAEHCQATAGINRYYVEF